MKLRIFFIVLFYCIQFQLPGQISVEAMDHTSQIEYEKTEYCSQYDGELNEVFKVSGLTNGFTYSLHFQDPNGTDNFDEIQFISKNYWNWDVLDDDYYTQRWTWEGSNNGVDYFSVFVTVDSYSDVELGMDDNIHFQVVHQNDDDDDYTNVEVVTSMSIPDPPNLDCSNPVSYTLSNKPAESSSTWIIKQNGSTKASGSGTVASASNISNGAVDVEFTVSFSCGLESLTFSEEYGFGIFNYSVVTGTTGVCPDTYYTYTTQVPGGHDDSYSYSWTYPSNWMWPQKIDNTIRLKTPLYNPDYGTVRASITNACGTSGYTGVTVYPGYCGGYYMSSPNPGSDYIDIDILPSNNSVKEASVDKEIIIKMFDKMGTVKHMAEIKGVEFPYRINTSAIPKGNYVVHILNGKYTESLQVIVEH
jgi:hypothetical protein